MNSMSLARAHGSFCLRLHSNLIRTIVCERPCETALQTVTALTHRPLWKASIKLSEGMQRGKNTCSEFPSATPSSCQHPSAVPKIGMMSWKLLKKEREIDSVCTYIHKQQKKEKGAALSESDHWTTLPRTLKFWVLFHALCFKRCIHRTFAVCT